MDRPTTFAHDSLQRSEVHRGLHLHGLCVVEDLDTLYRIRPRWNQLQVWRGCRRFVGPIARQRGRQSGPGLTPFPMSSRFSQRGSWPHHRFAPVTLLLQTAGNQVSHGEQSSNASSRASRLGPGCPGRRTANDSNSFPEVPVLAFGSLPQSCFREVLEVLGHILP